MTDMTFEQVYEMAEQLTVEEKTLLVEKLQAELVSPLAHTITREDLLMEMEELRASGAFNNVESLYGKYANQNVDVSEEEMTATLREIRDQWKEDLEELNNGQPD
jgi:acetolactate synthase small subunit